LQTLHEIGGSGEQHAVAVPDQGMTEGSAEMRLSRASRSSVIVPGVWDQRCGSRIHIIHDAARR